MALIGRNPDYLPQGEGCFECMGTGFVEDERFALDRNGCPDCQTDVCLAGNPARRGRCGDHECVCAPTLKATA